MLTLYPVTSKNCPAAGAHPFYVSVTEIRSDSQKQTFSVSVRMFTDDIQQALFKLYGYKGELNAEDGSASAFLGKYIPERLGITVAGKAVALQWVGYETEEEATWCHLEVRTFPGTGTIAVTNRILYDFIEEQTNLVHCYRDGTRSSYKLMNPEVAAQF